ncbi:hypothetical protein kuro4_24990 [Gelria sp. Kuro-4]|nr:hypothetical protein kuro4_24990 [Gelria sp. Kuro-4]
MPPPAASGSLVRWESKDTPRNRLRLKVKTGSNDQGYGFRESRRFAARWHPPQPWLALELPG